MPERFRRSPGRPLREQALPWDIYSVVPVALFRPVVHVLAGGRACVKGAAIFIRLAGGTNDTVKIRSAGSWCAAGRRPSDSNNAVSSRKYAKPVRQPSVSGAPGGVLQASVPVHAVVTAVRVRKNHRTRTGARGHAAKVLWLPFVTDPVVMTRYVHRAVAGRATVAMAVAKLSVA
jgi:hypothetical protein